MMSDYLKDGNMTRGFAGNAINQQSEHSHVRLVREVDNEDELEDILGPLYAKSEPASTPPEANTPSDAALSPAAREPDAVAAVSFDCFPVSDASPLPIVFDPLSDLEVLMAAFRVNREYRAVRKDYCELSILLNTAGMLAPYFRLQPKSKRANGDPTFLDIHRDQIVIDCHWLYCKRYLIKARDWDYRPLFDPKKSFNFDLAWEFANKNWKKAHRADEALTLTTFQQCQLVAIRGADVSARSTAAMVGDHRPGARVPPKVARVRQRLAEWCERDKRIDASRDDYEKLWQAQEMLGSAASVSKVAELFALSNGTKQLDERTIRGKLQKLRRELEGA